VVPASCAARIRSMMWSMSDTSSVMMASMFGLV
jgi:hypothetical protein